MTFKEYTKLNGIDEENITKKERKALYDVYRSEYLIDYQKDYRGKHHRLELIYKTKAYLTLEREAKKAGLSVSEYLKQAELFYREGIRIVNEYEKEKSKKIEFLLLNISNNINQQSFHFNRLKENAKPTTEDFDNLQKEIKELRFMIRKYLLFPKSLKKFIEIQVKYYGKEKIIVNLESVLDTIKKTDVS